MANVFEYRPYVAPRGDSISAQPKRRIRPVAQEELAGSGEAEVRRRGAARNDLVFLERWRARAAKRRAQIAAQLGGIVFGPQRKENLRTWLKNLQTRRMWLEARLEHLKGVEEIVTSMIERE